MKTTSGKKGVGNNGTPKNTVSKYSLSNKNISKSGKGINHPKGY
jgi:hypothetical protein